MFDPRMCSSLVFAYQKRGKKRKGKKEKKKEIEFRYLMSFISLSSGINMM
jgi:hypothetical protein